MQMAGTGDFSPQALERFFDHLQAPRQPDTAWRLASRWASVTPDRRALLEVRLDGRERALSFAELRRLAAWVAVALRRAGLGKGDRIVYQLPNWIEQAALRLAASALGVVQVPLGEHLAEDDVGYIVGRTRPTLAFFPAGFHGRDLVEMYRHVQSRIPELKALVVLETEAGRELGERAVDWETWLGREPDAEELRAVEALGAEVSVLQVEQLVSTSGTTGRPKIIIQRPVLIDATWLAVLHKGGLRRDDILLATTSMGAGLTGSGTGFQLPLLAGMSVIYLPDFDPAVADRLIERERVTVLGGVPTYAVRMLNDPAAAETDWSSLRRFVNAGGPLSREMAGRLLALGCVPVGTYGTSEALGCTTTPADNPQASLEGKVGTVNPGFDVRIVDGDGRPLPPGEPGEVIWWTLASGYYDDPEGNAAAWDAEGYFHSGDIGQWDEAGNLQIVGRKKDMILRGARNISPREVEEALFRHPGIADVAVVGMPDPELGERVCAFVVWQSGQAPLGLPELQAFLREAGISTIKWPERVETIERLPLSPGGKVAKNELRRLIADKLRTEGVAVPEG